MQARQELTSKAVSVGEAVVEDRMFRKRSCEESCEQSCQQKKRKNGSKC